jgi:hypothetical protein
MLPNAAKEVTQRTFVSDFVANHNFTIRDYFTEDEQAIRWLGQIKTVLNESFRDNFSDLMLKKEPTWGALFSMIDRVYEHESAALVGFFTGGWASMEVVVRAVIESAITVMFVTHSDRSERLGAYVANYFDTSRRAIDRLGKNAEAQKRHQDLEFRENLMRDAHAQEGLPFDSKKWPSSVFERFKAVGMENEYRHIYSALSSEAHNDAEALIDYMIIRCMSAEKPELEASAAAEMLFWMRFYLYSGLRYYALAARAVATAFEWSETATEISEIEGAVFRHLEDLSGDFRKLVASA